MHSELISSGLGKVYGIRAVTSNAMLSPYLGKVVRYKRSLLKDRDFLRANGSCIINGEFEIREVQVDYKGTPCLRGYNVVRDDVFGRCIHVRDIEVLR